MQLAATRSVGTEDFDEPRAFAGPARPDDRGLAAVGRGRVGDADQLAVGVHDQPRHHDDRGRQRGRVQRAPRLPLDVDAHRRADEPGRRRRRRARQPDDRRRRPRRSTRRASWSRTRASTCCCITGGAELVRDAFGTGKRVIAAGPGHADLGRRRDRRRALGGRRDPQGRDLRQHHPCIGEKAVVAADGVYQPAARRLRRAAARTSLTADETEQRLPRRHRRRRQGPPPHARASSSAATPRCCWPPPASRRRKPVGLLVAPVEREHPLFWMEQFLPFLPVVRTKRLRRRRSTSASRPRAATATRR